MVKKSDIRDEDLLALVLKDVKPLPGHEIKNTSKRTNAGHKNTYDNLSVFDAPKIKIKQKSKKAALSHGSSSGLDRRTAMRMRRGQMQIDGRLDLHGLYQNEARRALADFINSSFNGKKRCVLIITGKGLHGKNSVHGGVLRKMVPVWLNEEPNRSQILSFSYATPADGGVGALYVLLKRHRIREKT